MIFIINYIIDLAKGQSISFTLIGANTHKTFDRMRFLLYAGNDNHFH